MDKNVNENLKKFEQNVEKMLRENGFSFPSNEEELKKFNEKFGNTSFELPTHLLDSDFIVNKCEKTVQNQDCAPLAIAAREGNFEEISEELLSDLERDFDKMRK